MLETLKEQVWRANLELPERGLVVYTWGNVSGFDREKGIVVIKPSGVPYDELKPEHMVAVNLDGHIVEGTLRPSSDLKTHLVLYRNFDGINGIVHTHSAWAVSWAQAGRAIPPLGTTHADYFYGYVPCTRRMTAEEINDDYETQTGNVIVETFRNAGMEPSYVPGVLVNNHGPFTWGKDAGEAVHNAVVLDELAKMAYHTVMLNPDVSPVSKDLLDKHFLRKHGANAYYGQNNTIFEK